MADNYLENKFEEYNSKKTVIKKVGKSLNTLLVKNRSYRAYDKEVIVTRETLKKIVEVNTMIPSAKNQQAIRFKLIDREHGAEKILANIKMGGMLPELHLPFKGTEPEAFIIMCATIPENKMLDIDLGISAQTMLLKAVELGYNGLIIAAFNKEALTKSFNLQYEPLLILAIGKGKENIKLKYISSEESHSYYRENGVHYVPKVRVEDLLIS